MKLRVLSLICAALLTACGGGGGSSAPASVATAASSSPPSTGTPTASISASGTTASDLVAATRGAADAAASAGSFTSVPTGVQISSPTGVTGTATEACNLSGSITVTYNYASASANTPGDTAHEVFNNCSQTSGVYLNGSADVTLTSWIDSSNYAMSMALRSVTVTANGTTYGPVNLAMTFTVVAGVPTEAYVINGMTVVGDPVVTRSGNVATIASGTVRVYYGNGWVEYSFNNWTYDTTTGKPTAGTVTITGSNGNSVSITVNGSTYVVVITVNGVATTYNLSIG